MKPGVWSVNDRGERTILVSDDGEIEDVSRLERIAREAGVPIDDGPERHKLISSAFQTAIGNPPQGGQRSVADFAEHLTQRGVPEDIVRDAAEYEYGLQLSEDRPFSAVEGEE